MGSCLSSSSEVTAAAGKATPPSEEAPGKQQEKAKGGGGSAEDISGGGEDNSSVLIIHNNNNNNQTPTTEGNYSVGGSCTTTTSAISSSPRDKSRDGSRGTSSHDRLCEWKNELCENGDLAQAVVHIEVSMHAIISRVIVVVSLSVYLAACCRVPSRQSLLNLFFVRSVSSSRNFTFTPCCHASLRGGLL